jgi:ubiquinone/menaquinone biosynthesis C-methylase UbiE
MLLSEYVDPRNPNVPLIATARGDLTGLEGGATSVYKNHNGTFDFVENGTTDSERGYYDSEYGRERPVKSLPSDLKGSWQMDVFPWRKTFFESLGNLEGKKVLLLGNGESSKELYFLQCGAKVVFTDLSIQAVLKIRREFEASPLYHKYANSIEFHAVDALHLPFRAGEFDIIYGSAFVHHLDEIDIFFSEVYRCLRNGGICRFLDETDSPAWRVLKQTVLRPLKAYSHWKEPRSPADLRAEQRGGYTREQCRAIKERHNFKSVIFQPEWFFLRIVTRHFGKLVKFHPSAMRRARIMFLATKWLDIQLARSSWMKRQHLMLVWGFDK